MKKQSDQYSAKEAEERMAAALRGARLAKPTPLKDVPKKRGESQAKAKMKPGKRRTSSV